MKICEPSRKEKRALYYYYNIFFHFFLTLCIESCNFSCNFQQMNCNELKKKNTFELIKLSSNSILLDRKC